MLGFGIERSGRLVEHQDRRVLDERPGDGKPLPLAGGELAASIAQHGVQAVGQGLRVLVHAGDVGRAAERLRVGVGRRVVHVVPQAHGEEHVLLQGDRHVGAQALNVQAAQVHAVDGDAAAVGIEEARQERHQRALAGAGGADDGRDARLRREGDVAEHGPVVLIGEADMVEAHLPAGSGEGHGVRRVGDVGFDVEDLESAVEAHRHVLGRGPVPQQAADPIRAIVHLALPPLEGGQVPARETQAHQADQHRGEGLAPDVCPKRHQELCAEQDRGAEREHDDGDDSHQRAHGVGGVERHHGVRLEAPLLVQLGTARLDHPDGVQGLLRARGEIGVGLAGGQRAGPHARREPVAPKDGQHGDGDGHQAEQRVQRRDEDDGHEIRDRQRRRRRDRGDDRSHLGAVLVDAVDGVADAMVAVVAQRKLVPALHQRQPQALVDALHDPDVVVRQRQSEGERQQTDADGERDVVPLQFLPLRGRQRLHGLLAQVGATGEVGQEGCERLRLQDGLVQEVDGEEPRHHGDQGA